MDLQPVARIVQSGDGVNYPLDDVPLGKDDTENVPIRFWGKARVWEGFLESFK